MIIAQTAIAGVLVITPKVFEDRRGLFFESFRRSIFENAVGHSIDFVQDNHSISRGPVLRGLHFQDRRPQGKLVRVTNGSVFDVAVDIRPDSPTLGTWVGVKLSAENRRQIWVPPGLAHGFLATSEIAEVLYKTTDYYDPDSEQCLLWNDPTVGINWPLSNRDPIISEKDALGKSFLHFAKSSPPTLS